MKSETLKRVQVKPATKFLVPFLHDLKVRGVAVIKPTSFFVYGTLMRGETREPLWPHPPLRVCVATTCGRLYDLGSYPALIDGKDLVRGELWEVEKNHAEKTWMALDKIECFDQGCEDLYIRRIVTCRTLEGETRSAFAYFFAESDSLKEAERIFPDQSGYCCWSSHGRDGC